MERIDPDLARLFQSMAEIGPLPTRLPRSEDPDLAIWPCVVAPLGSRSFGGLILDTAAPQLIALFNALAPRLGIANLDEFDSSGLRVAALPFLPSASLLLLPHRSNGIAVPFALYPQGMVLVGRSLDWIYPLIAHRPSPPSWQGGTPGPELEGYVRFCLAFM